jgi:ubiquinone/menaquinone biosynthesis C-methylase UbiE
MIIPTPEEASSSPTRQTGKIGHGEKEFYTEYYKREDSDSPLDCRIAFQKKIMPLLYKMLPGNKALSLGAGRQKFEREMLDKYGEPLCQIITMDVADIRHEDLLALAHPSVRHIQASGDALNSIADESISLAYSILAFDFFQPRDRSIAELHRVLAPNSPVFLALHDPKSIIPQDLDQKIGKLNRDLYRLGSLAKPEQRLTLQALLDKQRMRDNRELFYSTDEIQDFFSTHGFIVNECHLGGKPNSGNNWREVSLVRDSSNIPLPSGS